MSAPQPQQRPIPAGAAHVAEDYSTPAPANRQPIQVQQQTPATPAYVANPQPVQTTGYRGAQYQASTNPENVAGEAYGGIQSGIGDLFRLGVVAGAGTKELATGQKIGGNLNDLSLSGVSEAQAQSVAASTGAYLLPGAAVLKGIGSPNEPIAARGFDVAVGVLPFIPFGEIAGSGSTIAKYAGSLYGRAAIGAGFGAAGSAAYGGGPTQIAEGAAIGAAGFSAGGLIGAGRQGIQGLANRIQYGTQDVSVAETGLGFQKISPDVLQNIESSGKLSYNAGQIPEGAITTSQEITQRFGRTGIKYSSTPSILETLQGKASSLVQRPPGYYPTVSSYIGGDPFSITETEVPVPTRVSQYYQAKYGISPPGFDTEVVASQPLPSRTLETPPVSEYHSGEAFFQSRGPSGPGLGPGYTSPGRGGLITEQILKYPPSSTFDPAISRSTLFQDFTKPGETFDFDTSLVAPVAPPSVATISPSQSIGPVSSATQIPSVNQLLSVTPGGGLVIDQRPGVTPYITPITEQIPDQTPITTLIPSSPPVPPGNILAPPQNQPPIIPLIGIPSFPGEREGGRKSRKKFVFGERKNPVNISFGGDIKLPRDNYFEPKKRRKR